MSAIDVLSIASLETQIAIIPLEEFNTNYIATLISNDINKVIKTHLAEIKAIAKQEILRFTPVRSGLLVDFMMQNLSVQHIHGIVHFDFHPPAGYPTVIQNPKHRNKVGWAPAYTPVNTIPNREVDHYPSRGRTKGSKPIGVYYKLNDPMAEGDYLDIWREHFVGIIEHTIARWIPDYSLNLYAETVEPAAPPSAYPDYQPFPFGPAPPITVPIPDITRQFGTFIETAEFEPVVNWYVKVIKREKASGIVWKDHLSPTGYRSDLGQFAKKP